MVMIYINFVEPHCLMLHVKFQNHRPFGSGEEDFHYENTPIQYTEIFKVVRK